MLLSFTVYPDFFYAFLFYLRQFPAVPMIPWILTGIWGLPEE